MQKKVLMLSFEALHPFLHIILSNSTCSNIVQLRTTTLHNLFLQPQFPFTSFTNFYLFEKIEEVSFKNTRKSISLMCDVLVRGFEYKWVLYEHKSLKSKVL